MDKACQQHQLDNANVIKDLFKGVSYIECEDLAKETEQAIGHTASYLACSVLIVQKCVSCYSLLVSKDLLNRGRLVCPSHMAIILFKDICHIYRCLVKDKVTRYDLSACTKPNEDFQRVMVILGEEGDRLADLFCAKGHKEEVCAE